MVVPPKHNILQPEFQLLFSPCINLHVMVDVSKEEVYLTYNLGPNG